MNLYSNTYLAISLLNAPKIHTDVLWDLTILFGCIAMVYFTAIFFFRNKISGKSSKVSALKAKLSPMISEFIFYDDSASKEEKSLYINLKVQIRDMLRDDFTRKVVSEILLDLRKDVSGSAQERLFNLFQDLNLHKYSYEKLESWRWERISSGIQELTRMEVKDSYEFITKFINDKRGTIRKQAEIGAVTLHPEGINYFLDTTRHKISEWQQLKLMEVLSNKTDFEAPSFMAWLTSTNKFVVLFALRLIKYYDQNDAKASIIELVKHRDNQIKQEAIDCIKAFNMVESLATLKKVFWSCSTDVKISILGAVGELGAAKDIPFLKSIGNKERNYAVTSKALSAINAIAPESILPTEGIANIKNIQIPEDVLVEETSEEETAKEETVEEVTARAETAAPILSEENSTGDSSVAPPETRITESISMEKENTPVDLKSIEVVFTSDFLPLVEENMAAEQHNTNEIMETPVNSMEVIFEEVLWKYIPKEATTKTLDINNMLVISTDLDFLPIVVAEELNETIPQMAFDDEVVEQESTSPLVTASEVSEIIDIREWEVVFEEIKAVPKEVEETPVLDIEVVFEEIVPTETIAPIDVHAPENTHFDIEVVFNNDQPPLHIQAKETTAFLEIEVEATVVETEMVPLVELEVRYEIVRGDEENEKEDLPLWLLNEIANGHNPAQNREIIKMEGPEWESRESEMMDKIESYFDLLPELEDDNSEVSETVQLLDDIALFGDEREIPLLEELMKKEDKAATKERIDALMKRFMGNNIYGAATIATTPYSVFEELFRNCDTESKLILLDEIVLIGDHKEIYFLEQLVNDTNKKISKKAQKSLALLKGRLEQIDLGQEKNDTAEYEHLLDMMELKPPKESDIFEIDFELTPEETETKESPPTKRVWYSSFISKLRKNQSNK